MTPTHITVRSSLTINANVSIDTTFAKQNIKRVFNFQSIPNFSNKKVLRLPVFSVIHALVHTKAALTAYDLDGIYGEIRSTTVITMGIISTMLVESYEVSTTIVDIKARTV